MGRSKGFHPAWPLLLAFLLLLSACASGGVVVLVPDPDGKVGKVAVSNQAGAQVLELPGQATFIKDAQTVPDPPVIMDETEIQSRFGEALAARPSPPVDFILYFIPDSAEMVESSKLLLPRIVSAIKERGSVDISVVGHSDTTGNDDYNLRLSRQRAMAVADELTGNGVDSKYLEVTSHGKRRLLVPTGDNVDEPRNRRVEVTVR